MQTTATAPRARKPKAPAIPALMPTPHVVYGQFGIFWATQALNADTCLQALEAVAAPVYGSTFGSSTQHAKKMALTRALMHAEDDRDETFRHCTKTGGLLYAWRGSRALVQALPSSQRGAA